MAYCPKCGVEYREGYTTCVDCEATLTAALPETDTSAPEWVEVYTGRGVLLDMAEDDLKRRGVTVARIPYEELGGTFEVGVFGTQEASVYRLMVPAEEQVARADEIAAGIAETVNSQPDAAAMAEAEQDFDVRGCPTCRRYFFNTYSACPCDGSTLLPAVDVFVSEQLEPGRVVVLDGAQADLGEHCARLLAAGFAAEIVHPGDCATALLCLPWEELTARTEAAVALLA